MDSQNWQAGDGSPLRRPNKERSSLRTSWPMRGSAAPRILPKPPPLAELFGLLKLERLKKLKNDARAVDHLFDRAG